MRQGGKVGIGNSSIAISFNKCLYRVLLWSKNLVADSRACSVLRGDQVWSKSGYDKRKQGTQSGPDDFDVPCRPAFAVEGCINPFKTIAGLVGQSVENTRRTIADGCIVFLETWCLKY